MHTVTNSKDKYLPPATIIRWQKQKTMRCRCGKKWRMLHECPTCFQVYTEYI